MADLKKIYVWYDAEGDYLEIDFGEPQEGSTSETLHKGVHVKLDSENNLIGFSIIGARNLQDNAAKPFEVDLTPKTSSRRNGSKTKKHINANSAQPCLNNDGGLK